MSELVPKNKAVMMTGPTACGKTRLAARLASRFGAEILGVDSRQVYRGLDLGSGKDLSEYNVDGKPIPYHMIDIAGPNEIYDLQNYCIRFRDIFLDIANRGLLPIACGGSPLYVSAIINRYDFPGGPRNEGLRSELASLDEEKLASRLSQNGAHPAESDLKNRNRLIRRIERGVSQDTRSVLPVEAEWLMIGVRLERSEIHRRIESRLEARLAEGMLEEIRILHMDGVSWEKLEYFGLEYKWGALCLQDKISFDEMKETLKSKIRQFAKRQDIWFRKLENQGWKIHWMRPEEYERAENLVSLFLESETLPEPAFKISETFYGPRTN